MCFCTTSHNSSTASRLSKQPLEDFLVTFACTQDLYTTVHLHPPCCYTNEWGGNMQLAVQFPQIFAAHWDAVYSASISYFFPAISQCQGRTRMYRRDRLYTFDSMSFLRDWAGLIGRNMNKGVLSSPDTSHDILLEYTFSAEGAIIFHENSSNHTACAQSFQGAVSANRTLGRIHWWVLWMR